VNEIVAEVRVLPSAQTEEAMVGWSTRLPAVRSERRIGWRVRMVLSFLFIGMARNVRMMGTPPLSSGIATIAICSLLSGPHLSSDVQSASHEVE
jgi:hypothetical protein